jgi:hypothetical protein
MPEPRLKGTSVRKLAKKGGCLFGCGTVFKVVNAGKETVLHALNDHNLLQKGALL